MNFGFFAVIIGFVLIGQTIGVKYSRYGRYGRYGLDSYGKGYVGPGEYHYDNDYPRYGRYDDYDRYGSRRLYGSKRFRGLGLGGYRGYDSHSDRATNQLLAALVLKGLANTVADRQYANGHYNDYRYGYQPYKK